MRMHGVESPYEKLKELTRGKRVDAAGMKAFVQAQRCSYTLYTHTALCSIHAIHHPFAFVQGLDIPEDAKNRLLALTPGSYIGHAAKLAREI